MKAEPQSMLSQATAWERGKTGLGKKCVYLILSEYLSIS
jgi:hypothetical protein